MTSSPEPSTTTPRLYVTAHLPEVISFSSEDVPQLEIRMLLEFTQPIIIFLKRSRLWPLHIRSALTIRNTHTGRQEYVPQVDAWHNPQIPSLTDEHKDQFLCLRPGETSTVKVSFRPYSERYDYEAARVSAAEKYKMLFPIGMQFLKPGETYEVGIQEGVREGYMPGDLDEILRREDRTAAWAPRGDCIEVVPGEMCQFRVVD